MIVLAAFGVVVGLLLILGAVGYVALRPFITELTQIYDQIHEQE